MAYTIAIQPDDFSTSSLPEKRDTSSTTWAKILSEKEHVVRWVDVHDPEIFSLVEDCHAFMWRWGHVKGMGRIAKRLLPILEFQKGLIVYPNYSTCWHYDDKIAQSMLFKSAGIPIPDTWVWFDSKKAEEWAMNADYPVVIKLSNGAGSRNVKIIHTPFEAISWIKLLFSYRISSFDDIDDSTFDISNTELDGKIRNIMWKNPIDRDNGIEAQSGYVLFQEFLPENSFDTRVITVGDKAWALRRFNRPGDFRASGSGLIDQNYKNIQLDAIELAFTIKNSLKLQCVAVDILRKMGKPVVAEISYTFPRYYPWSSFPGYWQWNKNSIFWVESSLMIEEAQVSELLSIIDEVYK